MSLFSEGLIIGGNFAFQNGLKHEYNSLKQVTLTVHGLMFGRAYFGRIFASEIGVAYFRAGLFFEGAYCRNFTEFYYKFDC